MSMKRQIRRITKLGISNFATVERTERLQKDLVKRLQSSPLRPRRYAGLEDCSADKCRRHRCIEACWFANRRRLLQQIPLVHRLLRRAGTAYEVRVIRGVWARPYGKLNEVSIAAANKLNRRALDKLYNPKLIAVGTFKAAVAPAHSGELWICEIHEIVAGEVEKADLERVFGTKRYTDEIQSLRVKKIDNLGPAIHAVLSCDLQGWQHPFNELAAWRPKKAQRAEFYRWLIGLKPGARLVRVGCDRHFNKLTKQARTAKPRKPRPNPTWLEPFQFGKPWWRNTGRHPKRMPRRKPKARRVDRPGEYLLDPPESDSSDEDAVRDLLNIDLTSI